MCLSAGPVLALLAAGIVLVYGMPSLHDEFFRGVRKSASECGSIAGVGLSGKHLRALEGMNDEVAFFPGIQTPYILPGVPRHRIKWTVDPRIRKPVERMAEENPGLDGLFERLGSYPCLIVYRKGHTKQVTNFAAPKTHTLHRRIGNLFFFRKTGGQ